MNTNTLSISPRKLALVLAALAAYFILVGVISTAAGAAPSPTPLSIAAPTKPVQPGSCCRLAVTGVTSASAAAAIIVCGPAPASADLMVPINANGQPYIHFSCETAGRYTVAIVLNKQVAQMDVPVRVGPGPNPDPQPGPDPEPGPGPKPDPKPDPIPPDPPKPQKLFVIVVLETADSRGTEGMKIFQAEQVVRDYCEAKKYQFVILDASQPIPKGYEKWVETAKREGLPRLFAVAADTSKNLNGDSGQKITDKDTTAATLKKFGGE